MREVFLAYILFISIASVAVCIFDKCRAIKVGRRIRERTLFLLCFLGGSAAMYATMLIIRHKTLHKRFMLGIPAIIILQLLLLYTVVFAFFDSPQTLPL